MNATKPLGRFFSATANDYYWNPEAFDEEECRKIAVTQFMGRKAVPIAEKFYQLRGDGYFYYFARSIDPETLERIFQDLERQSLDPAIPRECWKDHEQILRIQHKK